MLGWLMISLPVLIKDCYDIPIKRYYRLFYLLFVSFHAVIGKLEERIGLLESRLNEMKQPTTDIMV
jgi:hypothetical protein